MQQTVSRTSKTGHAFEDMKPGTELDLHPATIGGHMLILGLVVNNYVSIRLFYCS